MSEVDDSLNLVLFTGVLTVNGQASGPICQGLVNSTPVSVMLDTGAGVNLIHADVVKTLVNVVKNRFVSLPRVAGVAGHNVNITESVTITLELLGLPLKIDFYVAEGMTFPADLLLGYGALARYQIVVFPHLNRFKVNNTEGHLLPVSQSINACRYSSVFSQFPDAQDIDKTTCDHGQIMDDNGLTTEKDFCKAKLTQYVQFLPQQLTLTNLTLDRWNKGVLFCLTEPSTVKVSGLTIDCSLHQPIDGQIQLFAFNNTNQPIKLRKGTKLVDCSVLEGFLDVQTLPEFKLHLVDEVFAQTNSACVVQENSAVTEACPSTVIEPNMVNPVEFTKALPKLLTLLNRYRSAIALSEEPLGRTYLITHHINLKPGVHPLYIPAYRLPHSQRATVDKAVQEMLEQGVIEESTSPWNSPLLLVPKQDGTWRPCIDFRQLNKVTVPDRFPIPVLSDLLRSLGRNKVFSTLDLLSGFWQVPLDSESRPLTAFTTPTGHYEFVCMPFGLHSSPITFSRLMNAVFRSIIGTEILVYLDDIVVMSPDVASHLERLEHVLIKLQGANLKLKLAKCRFLQSRINYLGHTVDERGVSVNDSKTRSINEYPTPKSIDDVRVFLGMSGFYRAFVEKYSCIAAPLNHLLKKDVPFVWKDEQENAFQTLKSRLVSAPILCFPDFLKPFTVATDASYTGLGAVLLQERLGKLHPIAYASRSLKKAEKNYGVTELEGLAVVWALNHFREFILGYEVTICTDHRPLVGLFGNKNLTGKFARWLLTIQEFNPIFKYVPGKQNYIADALSRNVCSVTTTFPSVDLEELKAAQRDDPLCSSLISVLTHETSNLIVKPPVPLREFIMHDDLLCRVTTLGTPPRSVSQIVIPRAMVQNILELVHNTPQLAHPGKERCIKQARLKYFWPKMAKDIALHVDQCSVCNAHKGSSLPHQPVLQYPKPSQPWERVSMDILGGLTTTEKSNRYLLVIIDTFTRYCELVPVPNKSAVVVALAFKCRILDRYGCPKYLVTDNGGEFNNALLIELCKIYHIGKCNILPHHPASNGLAERLNQKIISSLTTNINFRNTNWDDCMSDVQISLNSAYHKSIGDSPHFALFGFDLVLPQDIFDEVRRSRLTDDDVIGDKFRQTQLIHQRISSELQRSTDVFVDHANRTTRSPLRPGDFVGKLVMFKNFRRTSKTDPKFVGPYRVIRHVTGNQYQLRHFTSGDILDANADNIKLLHFDDILPSDNLECSNPTPTDTAHSHPYNLRPRS